MIELCDQLKISKYRIDKIINTHYTHSQFRICRKDDIKIIGDYVYQNYENCKIGLKRKNKKYQQIKNL
jgi:hypothetical protein